MRVAFWVPREAPKGSGLVVRPAIDVGEEIDGLMSTLT